MLRKEWAYSMNKYVKEYLKRGLMFAGFGPVVAGIIYLIIESCGVELGLTGLDIFLAIISTYIMAFVHAGSSVFNDIESWGKAKSMFFQLTSIYAVYVIGYLVNHWIPYTLQGIGIFSAAYVIGYLTIWFSVYYVTKRISKSLNEKLKIAQEELN